MKGLFFIFLLLTSGIIRGQVSDFYLTDFTKADSIAKRYNGFELQNPKILTDSLTKNLKTDVEKFRVIFKWISDNISYDVEMFHRKNKKEKSLQYKRHALIRWQKRFSKKLNSRVITKKIALCSGYSMLLEIMCQNAGLQCVTIEGYGRQYHDRIGTGSINHAWNAVQLNNKWYLADPTWASGYVNERVDRYRKKFKEDYFLADPFYFASNHYPKKDQWVLLYEKPSLKEFLNAPIKLEGFIKKKLNRLHPEKGNLRVKLNSSVDFLFTSNAQKKIENVSGEIWGHNFFSDFTYPLMVNKTGELSFSHKFEKKGHFKLWIYLDEIPTFIYEVTVI